MVHSWFKFRSSVVVVSVQDRLQACCSGLAGFRTGGFSLRA